MIASVASGTQTAVISTEYILSERLTPGVYILKTGTENLVAGDTLVLRVYTKVLSGSSYGLLYEQLYAGVQTETVKESVPVTEDIAVKFTLTQTAGTARAFPWSVLKIA